MHGSTVAVHADGTEFDLGGTWRSITLYGALSEALGEEVTVQTPMADLVALAERVGVPVAPHYGPGKLAEELFDELVVGFTGRADLCPRFPGRDLAAHPRSPASARFDRKMGPLHPRASKRRPDTPSWSTRSFSASVLSIRRVFAGLGDAEAMVLDEEFLRAMEYGMPPSGGIGMGIDRLIMALTGLGIRETILFPFVRPGD